MVRAADLEEGTSVLRSEAGAEIKGGRRASKFAQVNVGLVYLTQIELGMTVVLVAVLLGAGVHATVMDFMR